MSSNAPRRYVVDGMGRHVLIGLTHEETLEFQRLDSRQVGRLGARADAAKQNDLEPADEDLRWLELYAKHDNSWKRWVVASRTERRDNFSILERKASI
ncbi:hypothetical protein [Bradyrhizobium guangxiense]|uniref:hypothetical protein n=1 Tax=Bradyrhizobium guangxiense TaxID=1325115 RepID=UPI0010092068|nr:hypothetical protein [Bradyrhizobium guangxiense]